MIWERGAIATFTVDFTTVGGEVVLLEAPPEATIVNPSLATVTTGLGSYVGDGAYSFSWTVPVDAPLGMWKINWLGVSDDGINMPGEEWFQVVASTSVVGDNEYQNQTVCSAWATENELINHCESLQPVLSEIPDGTIDEALLAASDALFSLSGRIFTGLCMTTVSPSYTPSNHRCNGLDSKRVNLGLWPIHSVISVKVDGVAVDPATYTLEGFKYLNFPEGVPAGVSATIQYGMVPPPLGKRAALALACELLAAYLGEENSLPGGVATSITRQGISEDVINPNTLLENGRTGIYEVDRFLMIYNPSKIPSPSFVIAPMTVASEHFSVEYPWPYGRY